MIDWKKLLLAQAPTVFVAGIVAAEERPPAVLGPLYSKIGQQSKHPLGTEFFDV
jgi:hypothetical protein